MFVYKIDYNRDITKRAPLIEYVIATNPDERVIERALMCLNRGEIIVLPTDTSWIFAANLMSKKAVESLYKIKGGDRKKHFSIICENISQASQYAIISDRTYKLIHKVVPGPYTFILHPTRDIPRTIKDYKKQSEIGIRIPKSVICNKLIQGFQHPIITGSISPELIFEGVPAEELTEDIYSYQIEDKVSHLVSMIIDPGEFHQPTEGSSIIDFTEEDEIPVIIREGAGDITIFQ